MEKTSIVKALNEVVSVSMKLLSLPFSQPGAHHSAAVAEPSSSPAENQPRLTSSS